MTIAIAIAFVMTSIQFLKKVIPAIHGNIAVALVVLLSVGTTLFKYLNEGLPITVAALLFCVEVVIGALGAYSLIKVSSATT